MTAEEHRGGARTWILTPQMEMAAQLFMSPVFYDGRM